MTKNVIVTGASRGIGREIAKRLGADGFSVVVNYAGNATKAEEVTNEITANGGRAFAMKADVSKAEGPDGPAGQAFEDRQLLAW